MARAEFQSVYTASLFILFLKDCLDVSPGFLSSSFVLTLDRTIRLHVGIKEPKPLDQIV